jgi:hypothetical protein
MSCKEQGLCSRAVCGRRPLVASCGGRSVISVSDATERVDWPRRCFGPVVPKVCSADPRSQRIRGYISVMNTLKFTYFFLIKGIRLC